MFSVVADFDGTLLKEDLPCLALKKFGRRGWERYDELLTAGKITVEECIIEQYAMIDVRSRKQVLDYIKGFCQFTPGLRRLLSECMRDGLNFTVVSAGLDFCIRYAFLKSGLTPPRLVCPRSLLVPGKGFKLSFPPRHYATSRDFKEDVVMYRKKQGDRVIFIGDGAGDFNAAVRADVLFAMHGSSLDMMCAERKIPRRTVRTLVPVQKFIHNAK